MSTDQKIISGSVIASSVIFLIMFGGFFLGKTMDDRHENFTGQFDDKGYRLCLELIRNEKADSYSRKIDVIDKCIEKYAEIEQDTE